MRFRGEKKKAEEKDKAEEGGGEKGGGLSWKLFLCLLAYRLLSALLCKTAFVPDEHWQSLEVAHRLVFGNGYLTWEWNRAIRGYTHPLIFAAFYKLLQLLNVDYAWAIAEGPKLLQALPAAVSDVYVYKLAKQLFGPSTAPYALLCSLLSWFTFYCAPRTLSNSLEAAVTPVVLYYWLLAVTNSKDTRSIWLYLSVAALSVLVRPTGAIIWLPLFLLHFVWSRERASVFIRAVIVGCIALLWSIGVDRYCYGKWVLVQYNFLQFNVLEGQSAIFGVHPWHWYFTQGVPAVLFSLMPLTLHGYLLTKTALERVPFWLASWLVIVHSLLSHKEFRFIFPILPIAALYAGKSIVKFFNSGKRVQQLVVALLLLANVPMAIYFSLVHQRGTIAVMSHLREDISSNSSVLFLLPCHSTPLHSHVHDATVKLEFLECSPTSLDPTYRNTEKQFYNHPMNWLSTRFHGNHSLPTHLVMFDVLLPSVKEFLQDNNYTEVVTLFHTHILDNDRVGHHISLYHKIPH